MKRSLPTTAFALIPFALSLAAWPAAADPDHKSRVVVEDFDDDPMSAHGREPTWSARGATSAFVWQPKSRPRFDGDRPGSLAVTCDSNAPTGRYFARFQPGFTDADDFVFGAVFTIRADGFFADPWGAMQVSFNLFDSARTGDERTGSLAHPPSDSFDSLEFDYFPNVSPFFGGPFLSPTVLGDAVGSDAFNDIAFGSSEVTLIPGVTYFAELVHDAAARTLTVQVYTVDAHGAVSPLANGSVTASLATLAGFHVDSLGIATFHDGYAEFTQTGRSLFAVVDYDYVFSAPRVSRAKDNDHDGGDHDAHDQHLKDLLKRDVGDRE